MKSSKLYFTDTGVLCYLLGISDAAVLARYPLRGAIFENLAVMEIVKQELNDGERPDLYFYRDSHGNEVDLLVKRGRSIVPVEIKSAATFKTAFVKGIQSFSEIAEEACLPGYVLYNGEKDLFIQGHSGYQPLQERRFPVKIPGFEIPVVGPACRDGAGLRLVRCLRCFSEISGYWMYPFPFALILPVEDCAFEDKLQVRNANCPHPGEKALCLLSYPCAESFSLSCSSW